VVKAAYVLPVWQFANDKLGFSTKPLWPRDLWQEKNELAGLSHATFFHGLAKNPPNQNVKGD
jgi:hypothetical protein